MKTKMDAKGLSRMKTGIFVLWLIVHTYGNQTSDYGKVGNDGGSFSLRSFHNQSA